MMRKACSVEPALPGRDNETRERPVACEVNFGGGGEKGSPSLSRSRKTVSVPVPGWALSSNSGKGKNSPRPPGPPKRRSQHLPHPRIRGQCLNIWVSSHVTHEEVGSGNCAALDPATFTSLATHHNGGCSGKEQQQRGS